MLKKSLGTYGLMLALSCFGGITMANGDSVSVQTAPPGAQLAALRELNDALFDMVDARERGQEQGALAGELAYASAFVVLAALAYQKDWFGNDLDSVTGSVWMLCKLGFGALFATLPLGVFGRLTAQGLYPEKNAAVAASKVVAIVSKHWETIQPLLDEDLKYEMRELCKVAGRGVFIQEDILNLGRKISAVLVHSLVGPLSAVPLNDALKQDVSALCAALKSGTFTPVQVRDFNRKVNAIIDA